MESAVKLPIDVGHWATGKTALVSAGVLAIAGAVGSALAIAPITTGPGIKWQGGWEVTRATLFDVRATLYTVPAGRNLMVTDLTFSNGSSIASEIDFFAGQGGCGTGNIARSRLENVFIPPVSTVHLSYETGMGFASGQIVCIATLNNVSLHARGYLFTAATTGPN